MTWPAKSADLNPIELVWDEPDQKVRSKQSTNAAHLWQLLQESCAELSSVYLQFLMERMLLICKAVVASKGGGHFDESKSARISFCFWFNLYLMWLRKIKNIVVLNLFH